MQAPNFGNRDDGAELRRLDRPPVGSRLVEREMGASPVIVLQVAGEDAASVPVAENKNVSYTLAPGRTDEALGERILPGAVRRREDSSIPMPWTRCRKCWPWTWSRSRRR